jgi:hypothetical protein
MVPPLEANTTLRVPARRAPSNTLRLPITLIMASSTGSATDTRTSIWAARWKTTSGWRRSISSATAASRMSRRWNWKSWSGFAGRRPGWPATAGEVVDDVDRVALGQQPVDQGRPDEAGSAGDEGSHGQRPPDSRVEVLVDAPDPGPTVRAGRDRPRHDRPARPGHRPGHRSPTVDPGAHDGPLDHGVGADGASRACRTESRTSAPAATTAPGTDHRTGHDGVVDAGARVRRPSNLLAAHAVAAGRSGPAGTCRRGAGVDPVGVAIHGVERAAATMAGKTSRSMETLRSRDATQHRRLQHVGAGVDPGWWGPRLAGASRRTPRPARASVGTTPNARRIVDRGQGDGRLGTQLLVEVAISAATSRSVRTSPLTTRTRSSIRRRGREGMAPAVSSGSGSTA